MSSFLNVSSVLARVSRGRLGRVLAAFAFVGLAASCDDSTGPQRLQTLTITPVGPVTLAGGATQQFTVTGTDTDGDPVQIDGETWAVVAGGGTINASTGLFTAGTAAGTFTNTVRVTCNGITAFATVIVSPGPAASIVVAPDTTLVVGATAQFRAVISDANGNVLTVTPVWSTANPPGTIVATTGLFTAGNTAGSFPNSVQACIPTTTICDQANVIVTAGPAASIVVAPDTTLVVGATAQFRAVVSDAFGNTVTSALVWSVINPVAGNLAGTITAAGLFTAGNTVGSFPNSVQACVDTTTICDQADVTVISPPAPPAISGFTVLAFAAVTCTDGSIIGEIGTDRASGDAPPGSITLSICPISSGTAQVGTPAAKTAFSNFVTTYNSLATEPCGVVLTGTLAGANLPPGVYCFDAGASPTGTLTLTGTSTDRWLFKIGTTGTGGLTPGLFTVVMAGTSQACNVTWWVQQAASITDSDFSGSVLAGAGITLTRGSFNGNAWAGASATGGDVTITGPLATAVTGCP